MIIIHNIISTPLRKHQVNVLFDYGIIILYPPEKINTSQKRATLRLLLIVVFSYPLDIRDVVKLKLRKHLSAFYCLHQHHMKIQDAIEHPL